MFQDPKRYQAKHHYVTAAGADLVEVLDSQVGERVLDLGCGTGQLSAQIAAAGAEVMGIDLSAEMVEAAREQFPALSFVVGDAGDFSFAEPFDAVFSNAALHWVKPPEAALACIVACLRQGGRFVAELGGARNVATISRALIDQLAARGFYPQLPWYFPRLGEYTRLVEQAGLRVAYASHFSRPTPLEGEKRVARLDGDVRWDAYRGRPPVDARRAVGRGGGRCSPGIVRRWGLARRLLAPARSRLQRVSLRPLFMKPSHVIWDWNGTLVDDAWLCVEIVNELLARRGLAPTTPCKYSEVFGFPLRSYYQRVGFDLEREDFEAMGDEFNICYNQRRRECRLREGAREALAALSRNGIGQSLLSASDQVSLEEMVADYGLRPHFAAVAGVDNGLGEGKIERGHRHLADLNCRGDEVLLVGDTLHDIEVAAALGVPCVLLPSGHQSRHRLEMGECAVVDGLFAVAALLDLKGDIHD